MAPSNSAANCWTLLTESSMSRVTLTSARDQVEAKVSKYTTKMYSMFLRAHAHTHTHTHTYAHICTHMHTYAHTRAHSLSLSVGKSSDQGKNYAYPSSPLSGTRHFQDGSGGAQGHVVKPPAAKVSYAPLLWSALAARDLRTPKLLNWLKRL